MLSGTQRNNRNNVQEDTTALYKLTQLRKFTEEILMNNDLEKTEQLYDPLEVYDLCSQVLSDHVSTLDRFEKLAIAEQGVLSCLLLNRYEKARFYIDLIESSLVEKTKPKSLNSDTESTGSQKKSVVKSKYNNKTSKKNNVEIDDTDLGSGSVRLEILNGMLLEAEGKWDQAIKRYKEILEHDETQIKARKRIVAALIASDKKSEAIEHLVDYLDTFMQDVDAWGQLGELYLSEFKFKQAAYCFEETILQRPQVHLYHIRYAQVMYLMKNYRTALKHYCRALDLFEEDVLSLYGIRQCCLKLKSVKEEVELMDELLLMVKTKLSDIYSIKNGVDKDSIRLMKKLIEL